MFSLQYLQELPDSPILFLKPPQTPTADTQLNPFRSHAAKSRILPVSQGSLQPSFPTMRPRTLSVTHGVCPSTPSGLIKWRRSLAAIPFTINTCETASKQTTLTSFEINTYEKTGGRGILLTTDPSRDLCPSKHNDHSYRIPPEDARQTLLPWKDISTTISP